MVDRKDKRFFDFMCSCGDTGRERCDKVYDDVMAEFNEDVASYTKLDAITDRQFITYLVHKLDYMKNGWANIDRIYTDMWSGIAVTYQYNFKEQLECEDEQGDQVRECKCDNTPNYDCQYSKQSFWIECDEIHHGLARAYQMVKEFDRSLGE